MLLIQITDWDQASTPSFCVFPNTLYKIWRYRERNRELISMPSWSQQNPWNTLTDQKGGNRKKENIKQKTNPTSTPFFIFILKCGIWFCIKWNSVQINITYGSNTCRDQERHHLQKFRCWTVWGKCRLIYEIFQKRI